VLSGASYTVTLAGNASIHSLTQAQPASTLAVTGGTLGIAGTYALQAGTLSLDGATLQGGACISSAAQVAISNQNTLSNLSWSGAVTIIRADPQIPYARIALAGDRFNGPAGGGSLTLGQGVLATLDGGTTLDNAAITLDGASLQQSGGSLALTVQDSVAATGMAALGNASGTLTNAGRINAAGNGTTLTVAAANFSNQGTMVVGSGATLFLDAGQIANTGRIAVGAGGTLGIQTGSMDRFTNGGVIGVSGGTLLLDLALTTAQLAAFPVAAGTLALAGPLDNAGATLRPGTAGLPNLLLQGGTITGGTILGNAGFSVGLPPPGTPSAGAPSLLSGVTIDGTLHVGASSDTQLTIADGLAVHGPAGSGAGTIEVTGGSTLTFLGTQSLDTVTIDLGGAGYTYFPDSLYAAGQLTLSAQVTVNQTGSQASLQGSGPVSILNRGTISAASAGGTFLLSSLANAGLVAVSNGGTAVLQGVTNAGTITDSAGALSVMGSLVNTGLIAIRGAGARYDGSEAFIAGLNNTGVVSVSNGATATLGRYGIGWTNGGTLAIAGAELSVGGTFSLSQLGTVQIGQGGTLGLAGTLVNTATLAIGAGTALAAVAFENGGAVQGGTITDAGGGILAQGGTLSGVAYRGVLSLGAAGASLTINNGIAATGPQGSGSGSFAVTGVGATLAFGTTETLDHVQVSLGAAGAGTTLATSLGQTLTLGRQASIRQTGQAATLGSPAGSIVNQGQILASQQGGTLTLLGSFANAGTLAVSNGETLVLQTTSLSNSGTISVTNAVVDAVQLTAPQLAAIHLVNSTVAVTGTLTATGSTVSVGAGRAIPVLKLNGELLGGTIQDWSQAVQFVGASVLDGVTYQGAMTIDRPFTTVTITDGLTLCGASGTQPGTLTLTGPGATLVWDSTQALDTATVRIGSTNPLFAAPAIVSATGNAPPVLLGAHLRVQQAGTYATIGGFAGAVSSAATITANVAHGQIALDGDRFTNTGTIGINNTDTVTDDAAGFTNAGLIVVGVGSALDLSLIDYFASGSLADQSFANTGSIVMAGGILAELTDDNTFPNVPLLNAPGASIAGAGVVASQIDNDGVIEARYGVLNLVQTVSGAGVMKVDPGAMLVLGGVGQGQTVGFSGTGGVLGLQPAAFLGTIAGFAAGDTIDLFDTTARSAAFSGHFLNVTLDSGDIVHFAVDTVSSSILNVTRGTHGDSLISFAGASPQITPGAKPMEIASVLPAIHPAHVL
jgi:hypothetical protein